MAKPATTRTFGTLHFEDLDPHRFEDLIRELVYDYKDWQSIEATGRSGSDEGWDIRAFERAPSADADDDEEAPPRSQMNGNAWMIQVKRERAIRPSDVKRIVSGVSVDDLPYGYILAAPANFSKKSYDAFRTELRKKNVSEFYVWGRAELEDMLHMPKNDRILFTFFGISLVTRRRSRTAEVRNTIATKKKVYRAIGEGRVLHEDVLLRDLADVHYPYRAEYKDFERSPRWRQLRATSNHPLGLVLETHRYYAYLDRVNLEWDYTEAVDLCQGDHTLREPPDERREFRDMQAPVLNFWHFLPKARQAVLVVHGLLQYADIAAVDEDGDVLYECPHIFVDFDAPTLFQKGRRFLTVGSDEIQLTDEYRRVKKFPANFDSAPVTDGAESTVTLSDAILKDFDEYRDVGALYAIDDRYVGLRPCDILVVQGMTAARERALLLQVTHVAKLLWRDYLKEHEPFKARSELMKQVGRDLRDDEPVTVVEYDRHYRRTERTIVGPETVIVVPEEP